MPGRQAGEARYLAYAVAAAVLWGTLGVAYKLAVAWGARGEWVIVGRPLLASAASPAVALYERRVPSRWSAAVGLGGLAPLYVTYFLAVEEVGAAMASVLLYTAPIWVVVAGRLLGVERATRARLAAVVLGIAGAWLVASPTSEGFNGYGVLLGLASGASYAAYIILARVAGLRGVPVSDVAVHSLPFAAAAVYVLLRPGGLPGFKELASALYLALAGTLAPYVLNAAALKRLEASRVSVISLLEPVTAIALAFAVLHESLSAGQVLGAAMVIAAALMAVRG